MVYAGAKIVGPVSISSDAVIRANAVVITDVPSNSIAVEVPAVVRPGSPELSPRLDPVGLNTDDPSMTHDVG